MPYSFENTVKKSLESKHPIEVEVIDRPITANGLVCPDPRVNKVMSNAATEEVMYLFGEKISDVNERAKFTRAVQDCTGLAVIGKDRSTGKQISFISHGKDAIIFDVVSNYWASMSKEDRQKIPMKFDPYNQAEDPNDNLATYRQYECLLEDRMREIRNHCDHDTIDAIIFGGKIIEKKEKGGVVQNIPMDKIEKARIGYERSVATLKAISSSILGIEARVAHPPRIFQHDTKFSNGMTAVLDTKNRKFYDWIVY